MTAQYADILCYQDKAHSICNEPLSKWLEEQSIKFHTPSTALWRGYKAKWLLSDNKLYLIDLKAYLDCDNQVGLDYLFPQQSKVFANWFTGTIKINQGELIQYIHSGYDSIYERSIFLVFENGTLVDKHMKNNNSFSARIRRRLMKMLFSDDEEETLF